MYSTMPNFVLGFHGCDLSVYEKVIQGQAILKQSNNDYDWLGHGVYFWESNPQRANEFAGELKERGKIKSIAVIGAIIDLGYCLNLIDTKSLKIVKATYEMMKLLFESIGKSMPENRNISKNTDLLLRNLDCAVIESLHQYRKINNEREFDTIRGLFLEGEPLYPNAGFNEKNHIQICVRNPNCIKGYFKPMESTIFYPIP